MMGPFERVLLLVSLGAWVGCRPTEPEPRTQTSAVQTCSGPFAEAIGFLGMSLPSPRCMPFRLPDGTQIDSVPLFGAAAPGRLARYCRLRTLGPWPDLQDVEDELRAINGNDPGVVVSAAHPGVMLQGPLASNIGVEMRTRFRNEVGAPNLSTLPQGTNVPVIAMIDSSPAHLQKGWSQLHAQTPGLAADHGLTLTRIVEELVCDRGDPFGGCLAEVYSFPALRLNPGLANGSTHGTLVDLSRSIYDAVDRYRPQGAAQPRKLVINLSLGWVDASCMGGTIGDVVNGEQAGAGAVHEAIQFAQCQGAVVVAAAGNDLGPPHGPMDDGLIYPAAWSQQPGLDEVGCSLEFGSNLFGGPVQHLVLAAGAIAPDGQPIGLSRRNGEPHLVTAGSKASALRAPAGNDSTVMISGTSLSAAVVSAAAASMQWGDPNLRPADLETVLYASASQLARPPSPLPPRRVLITAAMDAACVRATGSRCGYSPVNVPNQTLKFGSPDDGRAEFSDDVCLVDRMAFDVVRDNNASADVCDALTLESVDEKPWVHSQPGVDVCPPCVARVLTNSVDLYLDLGPTNPWMEPTVFVLQQGTSKVTYQMPAYVNQPGYFVLHLAPPSWAGRSMSAKLLFRDATTNTVTASEIEIVP